MASRSEQACQACKKHKRRCDKGLPECSLCRRTGRTCEYGITENPYPTPSDWDSMQARISELESHLSNLSRVPDASSFSSPDTGPPSSSSVTLRTSVDAHRAAPTSNVASTVDEDRGANSGSGFPASMFLDIDCYIWSRARLPPPRGAIPAPVLALLGQGNVVLDVAHDYFTTIHPWFPIVSKKRMDMGLPVQTPGPDLAMLFLAMKLVTTAPEASAADTDLYSTAKSFLAHLEGSGAVSLLCLQAMVLVALYEYGHAIYPAAWMSIGSCARYSDILGLIPGEYCVLGHATTWTEVEERRRVWWGIFILDKLVSMGSRRQCLVPEPQPEGRLPVNDEAWDGGEVGKALGHSTRVAFQVEQSAFARLCQASIYLDRAIGYARNDNQAMSTSRASEIMALVHEVTGLGAAMDSESLSRDPGDRFGILAPRAVARSALFVALDRFTCPEKIGAEPGYVLDQGPKTQRELDLQAQSMQIIELASEQLHGLDQEVLATLGAMGDGSRHSILARVSPLMMDAIYAGSATFYWLHGESGKEVYRTAAGEMEMFLDVVGQRWQLGGAYKEMLGTHDVASRVASSTG